MLTTNGVGRQRDVPYEVRKGLYGELDVVLAAPDAGVDDEHTGDGPAELVHDADRRAARGPILERCGERDLG